MARKFSFDNAAFHFMRTDGAGGFLPKFLIAYLLMSAVFTAVNFGIQILLFGSMNGLAEQMASGRLAPGQFGAIGLYYLLLMASGAVFWAVFEACVQRRYVLDADFSIGFGGDESRLLVVGLLWFLFFLAAYIGLIMVTLIAFAPMAATGSDAGMAAVITVPLVIAGLCIWAWLAIKLSAASALTIRDQKIQFIDSWGATRGRFWPLFGAYLILLIFVLVAYFVVMGVLLAVVFGSGLDFSDPSAMAMMSNPQSMGAMFIVFFLIMSAVQALFLYIWAGPAALIAKTDPRGGGAPNVADEFA
ncbi:MAG: hypothetical protein AAF642_07255 [Pseudomonadota bacterium]